jgi:hypothetical protein
MSILIVHTLFIKAKKQQPKNFIPPPKYNRKYKMGINLSSLLANHGVMTFVRFGCV